MFGWKHATAVAVCVGVAAVVVLMVLWRWNCYRKRKQNAGSGGTMTTAAATTVVRTESLQDGIPKLHRHQQPSKNMSTGNNYYGRGVSGKSLFSWGNNPTSVTDAVENGWSRFGFTNYQSSGSTRSRLLAMCAAGDQRVRDAEPEISWEVCQGSADFMQKVRLNPGSKKVLNLLGASASAASVIKTALPLPGPALGSNSFPQEAYFEIIILSPRGGDEMSQSIVKEGEKIKLIQKSYEENPSSDSLVHVSSSSSQSISRIEELKLSVKDDIHHGKNEAVLLSVGLSVGGALPLKLPGSYPGSIGFGSNGSVHLDGMKLVFESEKATWGKRDRVLGCGFDPTQKKVYFTVESELVHVIHCQSEEFSTPLYPTLAANTDITVLVNLGQSAFKYAPANAQRTPNPCFVGPLVRSSAAAFYEDSMELFSMDRIDSQWLNRCTTKGNQNPNHELEFDEESEADLFEIVLESCGRSPHIVS